MENVRQHQMPYVQNHTDVIDIQIPTCFLLHTEVHYSLMIPTRGQDFMASKYGLEAINGHRNLHRCTENIHRKRGVSLVRESKDSISNKKQRKPARSPRKLFGSSKCTWLCNACLVA